MPSKPVTPSFASYDTTSELFRSALNLGYFRSTEFERKLIICELVVQQFRWWISRSVNFETFRLVEITFVLLDFMTIIKNTYEYSSRSIRLRFNLQKSCKVINGISHNFDTTNKNKPRRQKFKYEIFRTSILDFFYLFLLYTFLIFFQVSITSGSTFKILIICKMDPSFSTSDPQPPNCIYSNAFNVAQSIFVGHD